MSDTFTTNIGLVLGSQDATPLEFWVGVREGERLQLDDLVSIDTSIAGATVRFYGIVDIVRKRFEGSQFDTDAFRVAAGTLPADVSYAAHVRLPCGSRSSSLRAGRRSERRAPRGICTLYFDRMEERVAIGLTRTGEPVQPSSSSTHARARVDQRISGVAPDFVPRSSFTRCFLRRARG